MGNGITLELRTLEMIQVLLQDNLEVNKRRLVVEAERLEVEKQRLELERESPVAAAVRAVFQSAPTSEPEPDGSPVDPPNADKNCGDRLCRHLGQQHLQGDGQCLMPGCNCQAFKETPEALLNLTGTTP